MDYKSVQFGIAIYDFFVIYLKKNKKRGLLALKIGEKIFDKRWDLG